MRVQFPAKFLAEFGWDNYHPDGEPENEAEVAFWPALRAGTQKRQGKGYTYIMEVTPEVLAWMAADARSWAQGREWDVDLDVAKAAREALKLSTEWERLANPAAGLRRQVAEMVGYTVFARVAWPSERPYYAQVAGILERDAAGTYTVQAHGASTAFDAAGAPTALPAIITFAPEDIADVFSGKPWEAPVIIIRPWGGAQ